jgi:hypothetical protein
VTKVLSKILCKFVCDGGKYQDFFTPLLIDLELLNSYAVLVSK